MKNLHNQFILPSILSLLLFSIIGCQHTDAVEMAPTNTQLTGSWEVLSYQLDGEEQMGFGLMSFYIEFAPEKAASGTSYWQWTDPQGELSQSDNFYTISADGGTILLSGKEYNMVLEEGEMTLRCDETDGYCIISAIR